MSAEVLRRAAALMRDRAEAATPGVWTALVDGVYVDPEYNDRGWLTYDAQVVETESDDDEPTEDAEHIASWHPAVALAVAEWLEFEANCTERACQQFPAHEWGVDARSLAVARAYLNADAKEDAR